MDSYGAEEWICRAHCTFFKADRTEEERCRGYSLASLIVTERALLDTFKTVEPFDPSFKKSFLYNHICVHCPFLIDGCDFTASESSEGCLPCGGLILISQLLHDGKLLEDDVRGADLIDRDRESYLSLTPRCSIKKLEHNYLYHIVKDELYEVNQEGFDFLIRCDGTNRVKNLNPDPGFLDFCREEDLLWIRPTPREIVIREGQSPVPSLRYLEWLVTFRCNLSCSHCYLGQTESDEFSPDLIRPLLDQFTHMHGLRILVSGGEPTMYRHFPLLNDIIGDYPIRAVLLTNGMLLDDKLASKLNFHEVQISLDGMERGHEAIRGKGTFRRAVEAMKIARRNGLDLSVATMIHKANLDEWDDMRFLVLENGAKEWSVDYPCLKGRWQVNHELYVAPEEAAVRMSYGFGGSYHGTSPGWTCGRHLAAVLPSGNVCRCGLYQEQSLGSVDEGLEEAWERVIHVPIGQTKCFGCTHADTCGGGCRYRAGGPDERDEVMCRFHGVQVEESL